MCVLNEESKGFSEREFMPLRRGGVRGCGDSFPGHELVRPPSKSNMVVTTAETGFAAFETFMYDTIKYRYYVRKMNQR